VIWPKQSLFWRERRPIWRQNDEKCPKMAPKSINSAEHTPVSALTVFPFSTFQTPIPPITASFLIKLLFTA
jgi:hypothetical protein